MNSGQITMNMINSNANANANVQTNFNNVSSGANSKKIKEKEKDKDYIDRTYNSQSLHQINMGQVNHINGTAINGNSNSK